MTVWVICRSLQWWEYGSLCSSFWNILLELIMVFVHLDTMHFSSQFNCSFLQCLIIFCLVSFTSLRPQQYGLIADTSSCSTLSYKNCAHNKLVKFSYRLLSINRLRSFTKHILIISNLWKTNVLDIANETKVKKYTRFINSPKSQEPK